ncbi:hypothetical protein CROQUDRAFT_47904 [Cronartium quercuum f. sp. fusiforme G11]|uniref:Uncharacterized protein n=1 Tax=Cronartium quercuum f. sp. fusiforme G11 TaxID=708437 RepID=A0A9P6NDC2_9BASI|nr:hypothetical protein CROQUDRAFT_47904 [Cronartium quercuum f. sp. fusiforme G11]
MIEELEDQEISDYLHRASKQLQDVTVLQPTQRAQVPTSNLTELSSADWLKVGEAYLLDILDRHCPSSLLGPDKPPPVSVSQLTASLERCYVLAPPALWYTLLEGNLGDLYRWKNPRQSTKYLLGYIFLWIFDLIPSFIVAYLLFVVVDRRLNPPPLAQLKLEADRRRELGAEAEKLGSGGEGMGMLGRGIGASAMMVGAPAIPQFASVVSTTSEPPAQVPKVKDQIGIYSLGRGLYAHYGSPIQLILADFAELGEKMKNLYLWRKPDACWRSCGLMGMIFLYTIFMPQRWMVKNFLGWLGLQFFFIFGFIERYPRFRKTFNPGYWLLYGVPTDAEYALELLRLRARRWGKKREPEELKSLKNVDCTLVTETTKADGHGSLFESERWRGWGKKVVERGSGTYRRLREGQVSPRDATDVASRNSRSHDRESSESRTFAMLNGRAPGHLIIGTDEIRFEPMKGFRTKVITSIKSSVRDTPPPRSSSDSPQAVDGAFRPSSPAIFIQGRSITRLRKTRSFGLGVIGGDGLEFMLENAEVFLFDNVANRDEIFHLVLSMSALADKRWALNLFT